MLDKVYRFLDGTAVREEVKEAGENCKIRSVVSYTLCQVWFR
jgi:hypothetical protein